MIIPRYLRSTPRRPRRPSPSEVALVTTGHISGKPHRSLIVAQSLSEAFRKVIQSPPTSFLPARRAIRFRHSHPRTKQPQEVYHSLYTATEDLSLGSTPTTSSQLGQPNQARSSKWQQNRSTAAIARKPAQAGGKLFLAWPCFSSSFPLYSSSAPLPP